MSRRARTRAAAQAAKATAGLREIVLDGVPIARLFFDCGVCRNFDACEIAGCAVERDASQVTGECDEV